jgi:integral membrane protein (TIGR01906 family)
LDATYDTTIPNQARRCGAFAPWSLALAAFRNLAILIFVLCVPAALVTTTIRFLANEERVYRYAIDDFGAVEASGIVRSELLRANNELIEYFRGDQETVSIRVEQDGREVDLFNAREAAHLEDVKRRFELVSRVQEFSVLYAIGFIALVVLWAREVSGRAFAVLVVIANVLTLAAIGVLGAVSLAGFDESWERFHRILFSNEFWRLDPRTDHLIQMFPVPFWQDIVFFAGLLIVAQAALITLIAGIYLGVTARAQPARRLYPSYT